MAQKDESLPAYSNKSGGESWGAQDSLRRSLRKGKGGNSEGSPLLGSGSGSRSESVNEDDAEAEESREHEWEGQGDFDGVPWWRKPSVSYSCTCTTETIILKQLLIFKGVLAHSHFLLICGCFWWNPRSQNEPNSLPHLSGIFRGKI